MLAGAVLWLLLFCGRPTWGVLLVLSVAAILTWMF